MRPQRAEGMPAGEVLAIVGRLEAQLVTYQINGGWAVDALVGRQTRIHRDVDIFLDAAAMDQVVSWLAGRGYRTELDWLPVRLELARGSERVDLHPMRLDDHHNGVQRGLDGELFLHPAASRTVGQIDGRGVIVADPQRLRELRRGYPPRPEDVHDLRLLAELSSRQP